MTLYIESAIKANHVNMNNSLYMSAFFYKFVAEKAIFLKQIAHNL